MKSVLITGCSSGIGHDLAFYLAKKGFHVYATVRKEAEFSLFNEVKEITPVLLDVTNQQSLREALQFITEKNTGLFAVVNNAGIGNIGFLSAFTEDDFQQIIDVNLVGPWRVTNMFLQLLVTAKGKIINIGSQGGMITKKLYGPYSITKYGLEAYTDALRAELADYEVQVSIVQPGYIKSKIGEKSIQSTIKRFKNTQAPFKDEAFEFLEILKNPENSKTNVRPFSETKIVSEAVYHALTSQKARHRYLVGTHAEGMRVLNSLTEKLLDENENPVHNFSRAELIKLLDTHLEKRAEFKSW